MDERQLTCIGCPLGCQIVVKTEEGKIKNISGYSCARGEKYAAEEVTNPMRMVTSIMRVVKGVSAVVSVKTEQVVPKEKIFAVLEQIKPIIVKAPIKIGDVLIENVANTGINIIATKNIKAV